MNLTSKSFVAAFRARTSHERRSEHELDLMLEVSLARAHAAWPRISVDDEKFAVHLATVIPDGAELITDLRNRHVSDLYLAFGCACGDPPALASLETIYLPRLRGPMMKIGIPASSVDEVMQLVRVELLVPTPSRLPRILVYGANGKLQGWLRAVAVRTGLRYLRKAHRYQVLEDEHCGIGSGLELEYMQRTYGDTFQRAFAIAIGELAPRDRLLLKQRFRHRIGVEDLGTQYGVHAGTITRWVQSARDALVAFTRIAMMRELAVRSEELASILRLIRSQVEITLSNVEYG